MVNLVTVHAYMFTISGTVDHGGYRCIRKGAIFSFPQTADGTSGVPVVTTVPSPTIAFYGMDITGASQGTISSAAVLGDATECTYTVIQG